MGNGITWANVSYDSIYGKITSNWKLDQGKLSMTVVIPPNTTATIRIPTSSPDQVQESGTPVAKVQGIKLLQAPKSESGALFLEVGSGSYQFTTPYTLPSSTH